VAEARVVWGTGIQGAIDLKDYGSIADNKSSAGSVVLTSRVGHALQPEANWVCRCLGHLRRFCRPFSTEIVAPISYIVGDEMMDFSHVCRCGFKLWTVAPELVWKTKVLGI
jgi:hypothetical protein